MDGGARRVTVHGVTQSQTGLTVTFTSLPVSKGIPGLPGGEVISFSVFL